MTGGEEEDVSGNYSDGSDDDDSDDNDHANDDNDGSDDDDIHGHVGGMYVPH